MMPHHRNGLQCFATGKFIMHKGLLRVNENEGSMKLTTLT